MMDLHGFWKYQLAKQKPFNNIYFQDFINALFDFVQVSSNKR